MNNLPDELIEALPDNSSGLKLLKEAWKAAADKHAQDPHAVDVSDISSVTDFFLIMSAKNERQAKAIASAIEDHLKNQLDSKPSHVEGAPENRWIVIDYVDVIIHIFNENLRSVYDLEGLWAKGKQVSCS